jgi:signal transduction histidine kinase/CheY-like chemotaxis protein
MQLAPTISSADSAEFDAERLELHKDYLRLMLGATVPILIITILRAAAWRGEPGLFYTAPVAVALGIGILFSYECSRAHIRIATFAYVVTLLVTNTLEMRYFPTGPALYLYIVIVVVASLLLSETGAIALDLLTLGTMSFTAWQTGVFTDLHVLIQTVLPIVLTGFVSYLGAHQLYTVLRWEWHSTRQAIEETEKAQEHRAEMMHLNKELDGAYIRMERMNRMLIMARKEAEEARMLKVQFANAVSHELRSPLNMIIGFSDMMVNSPEVYGTQPWPPRLKNHILQIYQSSQHLSQLVDDVLDLARIDAYRLTLNKQRACITDAICEAMDITRSLYDARNLYLRMEAEDNLPSLLFDRTRIRQVLLNFLTNALRFTRQGGVTIRAVKEGEDVLISVIDTGAGIAAEDLPKLFQEFTQLGGSIYRQGQGFGLGLAISKQLVELHGGQVCASSVLGQGSNFSFRLPIGAGPTTTGLMRDPVHEEQFWSRLEQEASERKSLVVCAPDSAARRLLASHLMQYDVTWVDGEADLPPAVCTQQPFAVIRIAPNDDDNRAVAIAQSLKGIPVVNCALPGLTRKPWISSLNDYLVKPISRRKLLDALHRYKNEFANVLIVEDEAPMREFLSLTLEDGYPGVALRSADSGRLALHYVQELAPDLILLDLTLPDMEGLDLADQIRRITGEGTTIVAVTARDYPAEQENDECDEITCARMGHISQRELERILNALLETISPSGAVRKV